MRRGFLYKHRNCLDACIYVVKIPFRGERYWVLKVYWVDEKGNLLDSRLDEIRIRLDHMANWNKIPLDPILDKFA